VRVLGLLGLVLAGAAALGACSSGKSHPAADAAGSDLDAGHGMDAGHAGDAGDASMAPAKEGEQCATNADCDTGLRCVTGDNNSASVSICGRPCAASSDCAGESCYSYTGRTADAHCINMVSTPFAQCGLGDTSICALPLQCSYSPTSLIGLCLQICELPPATAAGDAGASAAAEDDAGASDAGAGSGCDAMMACLPGVVASTTRGVCGTQVGRGETCGFSEGLFCAPGDDCARDTPGVVDAPLHCYEDCSATGKCSSGTCTPAASHTYSYCL
jgi:hypothetical protein